MLNRQGKIEIQPGYDGVYGMPLLKPEDKKEIKQTTTKTQFSLKDF